MWRFIPVPLVLLLAACQAPQDAKETTVPFAPPAEESLPQDARGTEIRYGLQLVKETRQLLPENVGNSLSCTNCHLEAGRKPKAAPFVGVYAAFPQYRARSARVDTLEDRINDCFERSLDGKALSKDSREMRAMVTYMSWLSEGVPVGKQPEGRGIPKITSSREPDPEAGKTLYAKSCAACHGQDGQGVGGFPPLWGPESFNVAAGMARMHTAAAFIKWNMPLGQGGSLSNEDAYDIAAYVLSHERPDFAKKQFDWPKGGKPEDAPY